MMRIVIPPLWSIETKVLIKHEDGQDWACGAVREYKLFGATIARRITYVPKGELDRWGL